MKTIKFVEGSSLDAYTDSKQSDKKQSDTKNDSEKKGANDINTNDTKNKEDEEKKEEKKEEEKEESKENKESKEENKEEKEEEKVDDKKEIIKDNTENDDKKDEKDEKIVKVKRTSYTANEDKCNVKFISFDKTVEDNDVNKGSSISLLNEPKSDGKETFVGWETKKDGKKVICMENSDYTIKEDTEFKAVWIDFQMLTGASIKLSKPTGIRFSSRISTDSYNNLKDLAQSVSFGTVICPTDYLDDVNCFTTQILSNKNKGYLDIPLKVWFEENDDYKEFTGVITNVKEKNYDRDFSARSYINIKYSNGSECRFYSAFDKDNNSRSIARVANAAVKDEDSYTKEQIDILKKFLEISKLGE